MRISIVWVSTSEYAVADAQALTQHFSHFTHAVFAAYALGGQPKTINRIADALESYQAPLRPAENGTPISHSNWNDTKLLGNRDNYTTYLIYFRKAIEENKDIPALLDKYLYSQEANNDGVAVGH